MMLLCTWWTFLVKIVVGFVGFNVLDTNVGVLRICMCLLTSENFLEKPDAHYIAH